MGMRWDRPTIALDAGDKLMMKQLGMTEEEYELFILDVLMQKYNLCDPLLDGPITGKHFDALILDDVQQREEKVARNLGAQQAHGVAYGATPTPQPSLSPLDQHREVLNNSFNQMVAAEKIMEETRKRAQSMNPLAADFRNTLAEYNANVQYYLSCVHDYFLVSAISLGIGG